MRINPRSKVTQRSIGFKFYQIEFLNQHPEFQPDIYCRNIIDEQIQVIDPKFWEGIEKMQEKNEADTN